MLVYSYGGACQYCTAAGRYASQREPDCWRLAVHQQCPVGVQRSAATQVMLEVLVAEKDTKATTLQQDVALQVPLALHLVYKCTDGCCV